MQTTGLLHAEQITHESGLFMRGDNADHPFFCWKKRCRKTAWDTPEYLTNNDWVITQELASVTTGAEYAEVINAAYNNGSAEALFYRVFGWPEGFHYCKSDSFLIGPAWSGFKQHELEKLQAAVIKHFEYCEESHQQGEPNV